ncbi:MAG: NrsF family protein [Parvibaculum sp.]|nr:NrsF family protein [Parvibaculum sp.]
MSTDHEMPESASHKILIDALTADLVPVRRLPAPLWRAAFWLGVVAAFAVGLYLAFDISVLLVHFEHMPETRVALAGAVLSTVLGAIAVFQLSLPDRSPRWALLPLPGLALWLGASGLGCLNQLAIIPEMRWYTLLEAPGCFVYIVGLSLPLSTLLIFMLRRGYTLHPGITSIAGGVTVAAASSSLLYIFHPFDATGTDILVHILAIAVVVGVNRWFGGRLLNR